MNACNTKLSLALSIVLVSLPVDANVWVFEPSASLDQRFDDNFRLELNDTEVVSATRIIGNLELSRESPTRQFSGLVRVDGLLALNAGESNELTSNQLAVLESQIQRPRSKFNTRLNFVRDTPNRDIASDITDPGDTATDTGVNVSQNIDVNRTRIVFNPTYTYNLSRRTDVDVGYSFTGETHSELSCEDALAITGGEPSTLGPEAELDDFLEHALKVTGKHKLSVRDQVNLSVGYSLFETDVEETEAADPFTTDPNRPSQTVDPECRTVFRDPRVTTSVETVRLTVGYERLISETLTIGGQLGVYFAETDKSAKLPDPNNDEPLITDTEGYLGNLTVTKRTGITRYSGKIGVEVLPSDVGDVVESLELTGDMYRELGPLLDFSFRIRAYEPDTISDDTDDDKFARRFLSIEPKLIWRFSRAWTAAASYRYRRQKSQVDPESSQSNAVLFSLKYAPPSAIADAQNQ